MLSMIMPKALLTGIIVCCCLSIDLKVQLLPLLCGHFGPHPAVCPVCFAVLPPRMPLAHTCALPVPSERREGIGCTPPNLPKGGEE